MGKICKFDFKFERKTIRRSIFVLDEALLNLATGVTIWVMTEPNLKTTKYRAKRQAATRNLQSYSLGLVNSYEKFTSLLSFGLSANFHVILPSLPISFSFGSFFTLTLTLSCVLTGTCSSKTSSHGFYLPFLTLYLYPSYIFFYEPKNDSFVYSPLASFFTLTSSFLPKNSFASSPAA